MDIWRVRLVLTVIVFASIQVIFPQAFGDDADDCASNGGLLYPGDPNGRHILNHNNEQFCEQEPPSTTCDTANGFVLRDLIIGLGGGSFTSCAILPWPQSSSTNTIIISDQASCENNSSGDVPSGVSGTWNAGVCTVFGNLDLTATDLVTVSSNVFLTIDTGFFLRNRGEVINHGTINLTGDTGNNSGRILNRDGATFTNFGTINLTGDTGNNSGSILNRDLGSTFTNSGTINLTGDSGRNSGRLTNSNSAEFINSATINLTGDSGRNSGRFVNSANFTNSGSITLTEGTGNNSGDVRNSFTLTNSGSITLLNGSDFNNNSGTVFNNCGTITVSGEQFGGNFFEELDCEIETVTSSASGDSISYQDPNLGDVKHGIGHDNGFCMNLNCINVNGLFNHFPETTVPQGSTQTFTILINCPRGTNTCNHIELAGALPDSDFYHSQWGVIVDRQTNSDNWDLKVNNPFGEIGEVTVTVQPVGQSFISVTFNVEFLIPGSMGTHNGIGDPQENNRHLHVTVWDNNGGVSNYIFNEGVYVDDIYAYPQVETSFETPLKVKPLCLNENPNKRYTCSFDMVKEWTTKQAEEKLKQIFNANNYENVLEESEQN